MLAPFHELKRPNYAVRVADQRALSFTKLDDEKRRTLNVMDRILAICPGTVSSSFEVFEFEANDLISIFDRAWTELVKGGRSIGERMPVFVPLDDAFSKNLGHKVCNLRSAAIGDPITYTVQQLRKMQSVEDIGKRFRQEIADRVGVDIDDVEIDISIHFSSK